MREIEIETFLLEQPPGLMGFFNSFRGKIDIGPPGKPVFPVPDTFAVTQKYYFLHGSM